MRERVRRSVGPSASGATPGGGCVRHGSRSPEGRAPASQGPHRQQPGARHRLPAGHPPNHAASRPVICPDRATRRIGSASHWSPPTSQPCSCGRRTPAGRSPGMRARRDHRLPEGTSGSASARHRRPDVHADRAASTTTSELIAARRRRSPRFHRGGRTARRDCLRPGSCVGVGDDASAIEHPQVPRMTPHRSTRGAVRCRVSPTIVLLELHRPVRREDSTPCQVETCCR